MNGTSTFSLRLWTVHESRFVNSVRRECCFIGSLIVREGLETRDWRRGIRGGAGGGVGEEEI